MKIRISDLRNFLETAPCDTMALAARKLGITPPALSESIQRFEADLGSKLFYRTRSGISLTPTGRVALERARDAMAGLNYLETSCKDGLSENARTFVIGAHPVVASYALPKAIGEILKKFSKFSVSLRHASSREIQSLVQRGQVDLGLVVNPSASPDLVIKKVGTDDVCVWRGSRPNLEKVLCDVDMFQTQSILRKWKTAPTNMVHSDNLELIVRLTSANLGLGVIPERAVQLLNAPLVRMKDLPVFKDEIAIVHRPEFGKNEQEKIIVEALRDSLTEGS